MMSRAAIVLAFLMLRPICVSAAAAPVTSAQTGPVLLFCSLERPVIQPGESVKVSVIADVADQTTLDYRWSAGDGAFLVSGAAPSAQASGSDVEWTAKGVGAGPHTLSLSARAAGGATGSCSLSVVVAATERGVQPQSSIQDLTRAFLARDRVEDRGYGLYSYLILPDDCAGTAAATIRRRCTIFIQNALIGIQQEKDMKDADVRPPAHLNLTYLLIKAAIPADVAGDLDRSLDEQVRWILDNYDYARCHKLLLLLGHGVSGRGPIVISTKDPVFLTPPGNAGGGAAPEQLFQDYSDVPLNIIPEWMRRFRNQSFQAQFWEPDALDSFLWDLRKYLAIAGLGLPAAESAVKFVGDVHQP